MQTLLFIGIAVIMYTYAGYVLLLWCVTTLRDLFRKPGSFTSHTPSVTVVVAAYNEVDVIRQKIENTLSLNYPPGLLRFIFVTDGSDDGTPECVALYPRIQLLHQPQRQGKINALHRAMKEVNTEIVVFTDANAFLNPDAILYIVPHYNDPQTGGVAGEKRVATPAAGAMAGEGLYWKYESFIKRCESRFCSVAGAAGELFSIRTALYQRVPDDSIVDDFILSMQIAMRGYRIRYEDKAYALESASPSVKEERKRKIRIAAGDMQALFRLPFLRMLFAQPALWFAYVSHRVLRWLFAPYLLVFCCILNLWIVVAEPFHWGWMVMMCLQAVFYGMALLGWLLRNTSLRSGPGFAPYYFCLMHATLVAGAWRYARKRQSVHWEKSARN